MSTWKYQICWYPLWLVGFSSYSGFLISVNSRVKKGHSCLCLVSSAVSNWKSELYEITCQWNERNKNEKCFSKYWASCVSTTRKKSRCPFHWDNPNVGAYSSYPGRHYGCRITLKKRVDIFLHMDIVSNSCMFNRYKRWKACVLTLRD